MKLNQADYYCILVPVLMHPHDSLTFPLFGPEDVFPLVLHVSNGHASEI